ncbi:MULTISPECIES: WbqC family protein [unclassified Methylophaga]|jgi:hypothetical protein|uniref:WbqC family protein n=1 Tax=unclassified Methylophaga TaxID=2629249 RepID=UPI0025D5408C|nr:MULTISPECIES: WbqC family protein [unclassified Methylophaga]|tara:strand:+ start:7998 stop:8687 length:690 start_codon:yes stop_codon:yes gene_type:complete
MKLAIMQPYFFPYIGYFQLISAADTFVVYDDVNFIKGGWINRNFILSQGDKLRVTLQLLGASPNHLINQIQVGNYNHKLFKTIQQSYSRASYYHDVMPLIENILYSDETNLAAFLNLSLRQICGYLGLDREWYLSSDLNKDISLRGQQKVLAICKELGAKKYINMPGGKALYDYGSFAEQDIQLSFLEPVIKPYQQNINEFVPNLSIIDVLMFNNQQQCQQMVKEYGLV